MDNSQAKLILSAYRSNGADATDPTFAEALEQVRFDPKLGEWFAKERSFDESFQAAFSKEHPPSGLKDSLMMNDRILALTSTRKKSWLPSLEARRESLLARRLRKNSRRYDRFTPLGLAAMLIIAIGISVLALPRSPQPTTMGAFVGQLMEIKTSGQISLSKLGGSTSELDQWLMQRGSPAGFDLPGQLAKLSPLGCQTFKVNGHPVSLMCYMLDRESVVHVFVIESSRLQDAPHELQFLKGTPYIVCTWTADGQTYVITSSEMNEADLLTLI